ncbi:MAG: ImmA/IrrE family metallo-endopeptidase [Desulfobacteraceae bacterium]|nr:ImmA/IrrE family metallo-endopeptidase [Desulfobacteraceae bacterium]MBC2751950.1 ImmA/IrrE family metallo-endopeptidase [Desulfobacteraceae bacterium]
MSNPTTGQSPSPKQICLFDTDNDRSLLDQLFSESKLYTQSKDYKDLLDFVVRLRNFAPFNAMLLQVQKPGLSYAASARDWYDRFGRRPKDGARPLLILMPFGPVSLVYDVLDTEGRPLPEDVSSFSANGNISEEHIQSFKDKLLTKNIEWFLLDRGDNSAGSICVVQSPHGDQEETKYRIYVNRNHNPVVQFGTLAHELGHLFLGHLGKDRNLKIRDRCLIRRSLQEFEAESVAYIVCKRNGVELKSQTYLSGYLEADTSMKDLDVYQIMKAAGHVETLLDL